MDGGRGEGGCQGLVPHAEMLRVAPTPCAWPPNALARKTPVSERREPAHLRAQKWMVGPWLMDLSVGMLTLGAGVEGVDQSLMSASSVSCL